MDSLLILAFVKSHASFRDDVFVKLKFIIVHFLLLDLSLELKLLIKKP